jgi:hypothetical protein
MKNKYILFILLLTSSLSFGQSKDWEFLPPFNFRVDSNTLLATWEAPKIVLLDEDFEGDDFPPAGWADTSLGTGWMQTSDPDFWFWHFPVPAGSFALVNDDLIYSNNGSLDYLITPTLDLTVADGFYLVFDSYFDGGYGEQAFIEYSLDSGTTWQLLHQMDASLGWENTRVDLSGFSGTEGESNIFIAFHADDNGYFASGWAIDNVLICSDENPHQVYSYKIFLDTNYKDYTYSTSYQFSFSYLSTRTCAVIASYYINESNPVEQTVHSVGLPKPDSLTGFAPDDAAILTWCPPKVMHGGPAERNTCDVGDVLRSFPSPSPITSCYGICDDGNGIWITDPNTSSSTIFKVSYDGVLMDETIILNQGQSWIGDMVSDGPYLYCCLIGGSNRIGKVDLSTRQIVGTIGGDFSAEAQMGLAADFENEEFYIGGWNSNMIWRTHFNGATISTHPFNNVSGLAWIPEGGPYGQGALWVMVKSSPNHVTMVDPNANWANIQAFMIPGSEPNSGAGIEIKTSGYYGYNSLWICNQVENRVFLVDLQDVSYPGPQPSIPENLIGFNLYKNDEFRDYIEYTDPDSCFYIDPVSYSEYLEGSVLKYEVTAVYDMTPYGFPGETGESLPDGPAELPLPLVWLELDFLEDWSAGTFDDNAWYITDSSWAISQDIGNEAPCAIYMPSAPVTEYEAALESFRFLELSAEDIILEYDVALSSDHPTGNENLEIQVLGGPTFTWHTVKTITNAEGSYSWEKDSLNISGAFNPGVLRIRFNATGENSADINYWAVDNIALTRVCPAPAYIEADLKPPSVDSVLVSWEEPIPPISEWKQWDDGIHYSSAGFGTGKESWTGIAARWTPELLMEVKGAVLTKIGFIPSDNRAFFKIAIWVGEDITPVYIQATDDLVINEYNIIQLVEPLNIDITQDLYVGYLISTYTGYPISFDSGPAIDGYGNMVLTGVPTEWKTLLQINGDLDFNWNIKAYFERDGVQYESYYRVFRSIDGSEPEMIAETMDSEFTDPVSADSGLYCYKVKALYYNGCESVYSPEACILLTETPSIDHEENGTVKIYPNPASDVLFIESEEKIEFITVYNGRGERVKRRKGEGVNMGILVNDLAPGLYLVNVDLGDRMISRKIIVKH